MRDCSPSQETAIFQSPAEPRAKYYHSWVYTPSWRNGDGHMKWNLKGALKIGWMAFRLGNHAKEYLAEVDTGDVLLK